MKAFEIVGEVDDELIADCERADSSLAIVGEDGSYYILADDYQHLSGLREIEMCSERGCLYPVQDMLTGTCESHAPRQNEEQKEKIMTEQERWDAFVTELTEVGKAAEAIDTEEYRRFLNDMDAACRRLYDAEKPQREEGEKK